MELSYALGRPVHELRATLPERDLALYMAHAAHHRTPHRRLQLQLAFVAQLIDAQRGEPRALGEYLFDPAAPVQGDAPAPQDITEDEAEAAAAAIGFNPRKKRDTHG